tara:strand:+ start:1257 stop:1766 length:510 start_codon:yes stop_codon:yes gene_type:complete
MANSSLENKYWELDDGLINHLTRIFNAYRGKEDVQGYKRLKDLIDSGECSYQQMKRIKNFFDTFSGKKNDTSYLLNGGTKMMEWVEECLSNGRQDVKGKKKAMMDVGMDNQFQKDGGTKTQDTSGERVKKINVESKSMKVSDKEGIYEIEMFNNLLNIFEENNRKIKNI